MILKNQLENIKEEIRKAEFVSFDIYDTLIVRSFWNPTDLFYLLERKFESVYDGYIGFRELRMNGEDLLRKQIKKSDTLCEDVTLTEIYEFISEFYNIEESLCDRIKQSEIELELQCSKMRKNGVDLLQYAIEQGKYIVLCSDMYLDESIILKILEKENITGWKRLFLSSSLRKLKRTGTLYKEMIKMMGCSAEKILHIGDDKTSDVDRAKESGIKACLFPRTKECFQLEHFKRTREFGLVAAGRLINYREVEKSAGYNSMLAIVANKFFDDSEIWEFFEKNGTFSPYCIGYYLIGMHVVGVVKWIAEIVKIRGTKKLHFLSRDGWLIKRIYDLYSNFDENMPDSDYLYVSREALLPALVGEAVDLFDLPIEYKKYSPQAILNLLRFCAAEFEEHSLSAFFTEKNIDPEKRFENKAEYQSFIKLFIDFFYDAVRHSEAKERIKEYLNSVEEEDALFDMGYSGRIPFALSRLLNLKLDVLMIHSDSLKSFQMKRKGKFNIFCFYDYTPAISGMLREYFLSDINPTCIGYQYKNGQIAPIFEKAEKENSEKAVIAKIHQGAEDFARDFYGYFGNYLDYLPFKSQEVSLPLEGYLREANQNDRKLFENFYSDDRIYGRNDAINIAKFWRNRQKEIPGEFIPD